jgi:hypothetical protein
MKKITILCLTLVLWLLAGTVNADDNDDDTRNNRLPSVESAGEASSVFSCFYECKMDSSQKNFLELTTLMLVNQSPTNTILAGILFVDGNEKDIAATLVVLSGQDLDEINVCETIPNPPPAGVIEVVLFKVVPNPFGGVTFVPQTGAYGWIKDLVGQFTKGQPEPFPLGTAGNGGIVSSVGKTQCRLAPPSVTNAQVVLKKLLSVRPFVLPKLIELTGDSDDPPINPRSQPVLCTLVAPELCSQP